MASSIASRLKLSGVYGLPTWRGLVMFAIVGAALWFSINNSSAVEQWISILMILIILIHLLEASNPFRYISLSVLDFELPFAHEEILIPIQITNPSFLQSEKLFLKFDGVKSWTEVGILKSQSSQIVYLPVQPIDQGKHRFPRINMKMRPVSELFQLWRVVRNQQSLFVLPKAIDHKIENSPFIIKLNDNELSHLELIQDPRLLPKMDQKLFQKTGLPYQRIYSSVNPENTISLKWKDLEALPIEKQEEQFSFWIKKAFALEEARSISVQVETPFFITEKSGLRVPWRKLKENFAEWLYEKS